MTYKEIEADDPMELIGVVLPATAEAMEEMAYAFAEEFAQMGYDADALLRLFRTPFYAGAHQAYRALGDEAIRKIIRECLAAWGGVVTRVRDSCSPGEATPNPSHEPRARMTSTNLKETDDG
ncbi:MAG TPA: hypothetical protein VNL14_12015 [Candidatus Acidoferrales bacterium]|nr:hypothetical protein [Candidatus Acidoferrales bacterium]